MNDEMIYDIYKTVYITLRGWACQCDARWGKGECFNYSLDRAYQLEVNQSTESPEKRVLYVVDGTTVIQEDSVEGKGDTIPSPSNSVPLSFLVELCDRYYKSSWNMGAFHFMFEELADLIGYERDVVEDE